MISGLILSHSLFLMMWRVSIVLISYVICLFSVWRFFNSRIDGCVYYHKGLRVIQLLLGKLYLL